MSSSLGPPGCPYDPGNAGIARGIDVRTVTLHRTIGNWAGDYSVGKTRDHDDGTFQHLIGKQPGQWVQFYPADTFCSHAAGSNNCGPGIEISGQNGEPLTDWQIDALGQVLRWYRDEWGIADTFREGDPRVQYDLAGPSGFVCHNSVFYPEPRYIHHDYITEDEFRRALGDDDMPLSLNDFDGIRKVVGGDPNYDGSIPTISTVVRDLVGARQEIAALSTKVDALSTNVGTSGPNVALLPSDLDAIAEKVADKLAARLKD